MNINTFVAANESARVSRPKAWSEGEMAADTQADEKQCTPLEKLEWDKDVAEQKLLNAEIDLEEHRWSMEDNDRKLRRDEEDFDIMTERIAFCKGNARALKEDKQKIHDSIFERTMQIQWKRTILSRLQKDANMALQSFNTAVDRMRDVSGEE